MLTSITNLCDEFESKIKEQMNSKKYLESICTATDYEQALLSRYPASTFELGLFQNEAHNISFHSPFEGWTQKSLKDMKIPEWLPMLGFDILIALQGKVEDDKFMLFSYDLGKIKLRIGVQEKSEVSDQELVLGSQMIASNFGVVKNQEFKTVGDHRLLFIEINTPLLKPSVILANLRHGGILYTFLLSSSAGNHAENQKRLYDLIKTLDFKYKPSETLKIQAIRQKLTDKTDIIQVLRCIRELALIGEYRAASEDLSKLRLAIVQKMPKPIIDGNIARLSAYGIKFTNPDPYNWKLSIQSKGILDMVVLEDRFSVNPAGIVVGVINTILAYGPKAAHITGESGSEQERKVFFSGGGRAGLLSMGVNIESERFRMFRGVFSYEGVGSANIPNTKVKSIVVPKSGYIIMILMFIDALNFNARSLEYEELLEKYLHIESSNVIEPKPIDSQKAMELPKPIELKPMEIPKLQIFEVHKVQRFELPKI